MHNNMTQNKLKLEVGKAYRTRDGRKVHNISKSGDKTYPFVGRIVNEWSDDYYKPDGIWMVDEQNKRDIVSEWQEPDADGWIEWHGGECPVDGDALIQYQWLNGDISRTIARNLHWKTNFNPWDIKRYRVVHNSKQSEAEHLTGEKREDTTALRDQIAIAAMQGMITSNFIDDLDVVYDQLAKDAYRVADAMLKAREGK